MRWAIITGMFNVADLVADFCRYHFDLGVDKIIAADYGSTDGTNEILASFVRQGAVQLVPVPTHRFVEYDPSNALLSRLRAEDGADWVSFLDPDEFLTGPANLKSYIAHEWSAATEAVAIPRANLTGVGGIPDGVHYLSHLTQKIVSTDARISDASATLSSPWIFSRLPPKVMVRVRSELMIVTGDHGVRENKTEVQLASDFEILHLPVRGYPSFQRKVEDTARYFAANPEFTPGIGWHWRRWNELLKRGQLRPEYESQFLDAKTAESLRAEQRIVEDTRLADWLASNQAGRVTSHCEK